MNANTKTMTVNFNEEKKGIEIRFNFALTPKQKNYVEKVLGMHWFGKKKYYWVAVTPKNYEVIATYLETMKARDYKITEKHLNGSMRAPKKATTK